MGLSSHYRIGDDQGALNKIFRVPSPTVSEHFFCACFIAARPNCVRGDDRETYSTPPKQRVTVKTLSSLLPFFCSDTLTLANTCGGQRGFFLIYTLKRN